MASNPTVPKPFLLGAGPLAPPIHGAAATTQGMLDYAARHLDLRVANLALGTAPGWKGHAVRICRFFAAIGKLGWYRIGRRRPAFYMACNGERGIAYNVVLAAVARLLGYRIFLHHHSFAYIDSDDSLMSVLVAAMGPSNTHVILCEAMAEGLRARYPTLRRAPMLELYSSAFVEETERPAMRQGAGLQIGFLSNLIVEKGLDTTIDLLRAARLEGLPVTLLLAGKAPDARARQIVQDAEKEFGSAITYLGPLSDAQKVQFFRDIDAFAFPTRYVNEAQPRAILESLAYGVPVLTVARSCITGDVGEGSGICVPRDADFVSSVMPLVRQWCADPAALVRSSKEAATRAIVLYQAGQDQLAAITKAFH